MSQNPPRMPLPKGKPTYTSQFYFFYDAKAHGLEKGVKHLSGEILDEIYPTLHCFHRKKILPSSVAVEANMEGGILKSSPEGSRGLRGRSQKPQR